MSEQGTVIMDYDTLDNLILSEYPYPIAMNYQRLLETESWEARTRKCIEVFEFGLRTITLGLLSQYLLRDVHQVSDPELDRKLYHHLAQSSLGQWSEFFFLTLRAYRGKRKLFFMPELYDLYWDTSQEPHEAREGIHRPFVRMVQIRNDLVHRLAPDSEKYWEALAQEALSHLRVVLRQFEFLRHYDLIRIIEQRTEEYEYERFTGQEITIRCEKLRGQRQGEKLQPGWFYLSREDRSALQLHPLFIFFISDEKLTFTEGMRQDAAVFDRLLKEAVEYMATVVRQTVKKQDAELIAQIRELLFYNIEHIKMARKRTVLSWAGLQRAVSELTTAQMGTVREKHRPALYLQREETLQKVLEFLASDKGCFVLTGKSGVGKSSFVLSLADEFAKREDLCLLMYNGARLTVEGTMVQTIGQDLIGYLTLEGRADQNLFDQLEQRGEMTGKVLLLVFDAINENVDGKTLLRQIDQMVGDARYPWLKVMITSRPQAWRTLKHGLHLAENRYFRERGSDEYWVELEGFTYTEEIRLDSFCHEELPNAYAKYQRAWQLQTTYQELGPQLREDLRDPLMLRLIAQTYQGKGVPERVRGSQVYHKYVEALVATERLFEGDLIFLEREMVPLMLAEGQYNNRVKASQVQDNRRLFELIHNDDRLSNGQSVNAAYVRLVDADILMEQGSFTDYVIMFKYERFYDYFGGKRLFLDATARRDKMAFYCGLVEKMEDSPYLWGPIKNALILELKDNAADDLIVNLAETTNLAMKDVLVAVLSEYGWDDTQLVRDILFTFLKTTGRHSRLSRQIYSVLPSQQESITEASLQDRIAVESAYGANLPDVLSQAVRHPSSGTRTIAIQHIYYLWKKGQHRNVMSILEELRAEMLIWRFPRPRVLFSCAGISAVILFKEYRNKAALMALHEYWRTTLQALLFVRSDPGDLDRSVSDAVRNKLVDLISSIGVGLSSTAEQATFTIFGVSDMKAFFTSHDGRRNKFADLIPYLDWQATEISSAQALLRELAHSRDLMTSYLTLAVLDLHLLKDEEGTIQLMKTLVDYCLSVSPPTVQFSSLLVSAMFYTDVRHTDSNQVVLDYYRQVMWSFNERARCRFLSEHRKYCYSPLGGFISLDYCVHRSVDIDFVKNFIRPAVEENDIELLVSHVESVISGGLGPRRAPQPYLQVLKLFVEAGDQRIRDVTVTALARIRAYFPLEVDEFLKELDPTSGITSRVKSSTIGESLGDLIVFGGLDFLTWVGMLDPDGSIMPVFVWWFEEAVRARSFSSWIALLIKASINLIYGSLIFDTGQPQPGMSFSENLG